MKQLFFLLISTLSLISVFAQKGFHAGVNVGVNSTWIFNQNNYGYSEMDYELKFGANPGLAAGYNFTNNYGVELGLCYAMLGQNYFDRIRDFGPIDPVTGKPDKVETFRYIKLNYLQVPILFRYQTTKEKKDKIEFHAMLGPSVGVLLSADQYYEADIDGNGSVEELDPNFVPQTAIEEFALTTEDEVSKDYFSSLDVGIQLDLGVDIYVSEMMYVTPALKLYGAFTDLNSEATRISEGYSASRNGFVGISVGIHYIKIEKDKKD
ncbi:MAG: porin family protein [Chitinophagales bacterium]